MLFDLLTFGMLARTRFGVLARFGILFVSLSLCLEKSAAFQSIPIKTSAYSTSQQYLSLRLPSKLCHFRSGSLGASMVLSDLISDFNVGDRVRVAQSSIVLFTVKDHPDGYSVPKGAEGQIVKVITKDLKSGKPVSPNRPLLVKFENPKFQAHFEARELEKAN